MTRNGESPMFKIRLPEESEVTFSHSIEPDDTPIRGNAMASGDASIDQEAEDWVLSQLQHGNVAAWCGLVVRADWRGFKREVSLWGNSYASEAELLRDVLPELRHDAFAALCEGVEKEFAGLADRIELDPEIQARARAIVDLDHELDPDRVDDASDAYLLASLILGEP